MQPFTILMATRNGATFLPAQLDSLAGQTDPDWRLWASDDGSTDATVAILRDFAARTGRELRLFRGPGQGAAANFLSLLARAEPAAGPVALCDQDDLWYPDKLARARAALAAAGAVPALYGAEADLVDAAGRRIGATRPPRRGASFANALVQNAVGGHSAALNGAAVALVQKAGAAAVPHHDWWLYQLVTGAGGRAILDPARVLGYRQHGENVLGMGRRTKGGRVLRGAWSAWIDAHCAALGGAEALLTPENRALLAAFQAARAAPGPLARLRGLVRCGVHRQEAAGTAALYALAAAGRL